MPTAISRQVSTRPSSAALFGSAFLASWEPKTCATLRDCDMEAAGEGSSLSLEQPAEAESTVFGYAAQQVAVTQWPVPPAGQVPPGEPGTPLALRPLISPTVQPGAQLFPIQVQQVAASTLREPSLRVPPREAEVVEDPTALPFLTDRVRETVSAMLPILEREAQKNGVPVRKVEIRGYKDPEEGVSEVVVRQWVDLPGGAAMEYWDRLGLVLDAWIDTLPPRLKSTALERVRVSVEWTVHARFA